MYSYISSIINTLLKKRENKNFKLWQNKQNNQSCTKANLILLKSLKQKVNFKSPSVTLLLAKKYLAKRQMQNNILLQSLINSLSMQHAIVWNNHLKSKNMKTKLYKKLQKTNEAVQAFIKTTIKNYLSMKKKIKVIWACIALCVIGLFTCTGCNVTRTITNQSEYYQRGDTSVVIQTKTIETYDANKKF